LGFEVEEEGKALSRKNRQDEAVIVLPPAVREPPLEAARTTPPKRGAGLVTIEDEGVMAEGLPQDLVPLEPGIKTLTETPQVLGPHQGKHPADRIGTGQRRKNPLRPRGSPPLLLQGMKAPQPRQEHQKNTLSDGRGGIDRESPPVGQTGKTVSDLKASLGVGQKTPEDGSPLLLFFQPFPGGGRDLIQEVLNLAVAVDKGPGQGLQVLGDMKLLDLALRATGENKSRMLLTPLTLAVRPATGDLTKIRGGVKELFPGDDRLEAGTALALDTGHAGRLHRRLLSYTSI